jgi:hypothetical protein
LDCEEQAGGSDPELIIVTPQIKTASPSGRRFFHSRRDFFESLEIQTLVGLSKTASQAKTHIHRKKRGG